MRAVHAIKVAHADQRGAEGGRNLVEFVKNLHSERRSRTSDLSDQHSAFSTAGTKAIRLKLMSEIRRRS
jgi:hypothetical protein